jgi:predicted  nucleic acid-binding Zn-ribbon protein
MAVTGTLLRELHRIHQQLSDLRERLERGPKQIKAREANVARCEAEVNQAKNEVKTVKMIVDQKQLALRSGENKILDLRGKLNAANSNREYQALKDQIAADEMANSVLSDEILEAMEKVDENSKLVTEAEQKLAKAKDELNKAQQQVRDQQGLLDGDVRRLEAELKTAEQTLPSDFNDTYQRIVKSKGAEAMAQVEGENCGGCYQKLTTNQFNTLVMGNVLFCQSCGRLLYLPEDRTPGPKK